MASLQTNRLFAIKGCLLGIITLFSLRVPCLAFTVTKDSPIVAGRGTRREEARLFVRDRIPNSSKTGLVKYLNYAPLYASAEISSDDNTEKIKTVSSPSSEKSTERRHPPKYLALGYNAASLFNILLAFSLTVLPDAPFGAISSSPLTATGALATSYNPGLKATKIAGILGYFFLGGGSCHILSESVRSGRLATSDTYKRLTFGTLLFGMVGLFSFPGEAGLKSAPLACILGVAVASKSITALVSFIGWEFGAGGFGSSASMSTRLQMITCEVLKGCKNLWKALPVSEKRPATFYRTFFIMVTLCNLLFNVPKLVFSLQHGSSFASLSVSLTISSIARLSLLSSILFIMKDAAERKRLEGGTFVKLNILVGCWALGVGMAQGFEGGFFNIRRAADKLLFSVVFLANGINSQLIKMGIISEDVSPNPPLRI